MINKTTTPTALANLIAATSAVINADTTARTFTNISTTSASITARLPLTWSNATATWEDIASTWEYVHTVTVLTNTT